LSSVTNDAQRWYVIYTHPKEEERASMNLTAWNVETFYPKILQRRYNKYTQVPTNLVKPLFPRYIFARFQAEHLLHKIYYTRGVHSIVGFSNGPAPVDDEIIHLIQSRVGKDGYVKFGDELELGDRVIVGEGPFKDLSGVLEQKLKDTERVKILLKAVSYQCYVVTEKESVHKLVDKPEYKYSM
jgi:transcription elongation factor/antiterminator RfaH